jgi:hypothetical protein
MASHQTHVAHPAFAGHVAAVRPFSAANAFPSYAPAVPVKAMWRKATAVRCTTTGFHEPVSTLTDGTDIATRRPPGGT